MILDALLKRADAEIAFSPGFRWGRSVLPGQTITLEDVYAHTALTYPNTWTRAMTGTAILALMEDVADNLFHPDPYYRQGGDMVRVGGLTYAIDPAAPIGRRIRDVRVNGRALQDNRRSKATGWASVGEADGPPAWDVVADHLRALKRVRLTPRLRVRVIGPGAGRARRGSADLPGQGPRPRGEGQARETGGRWPADRRLPDQR